MLISFTLSMPGNNAWDGKWSGDGQPYVVVRDIRPKSKAESMLGRPQHGHSFGDGWRAAIELRHVDSREAAGLRRISRGFCGYEWMIDSIIQNGRIK